MNEEPPELGESSDDDDTSHEGRRDPLGPGRSLPSGVGMRPMISADAMRSLEASLAPVVASMVRAAEQAVRQMLPSLEAIRAAQDSLRSQLSKVDWIAIGKAVEALQALLPQNWRGVDFDSLLTLAQDDGIPVVGVPNADILRRLSESESRSDKLSVLLQRRIEVLDDCRALLVTAADPPDPDADARSAVLESVSAFEAGLYRSAQLLAVTVTEEVLFRRYGGNYKSLRSLARIEDVDDVAVRRIREAFSLLPIEHFYEPYFRDLGDTPPTRLSRHATVHVPTSDHVSEGNALLAVMLATSIVSTRGPTNEQGMADAEA